VRSDGGAHGGNLRTLDQIKAGMLLKINKDWNSGIYLFIYVVEKKDLY
jgi:hypothetical protein